MTKQEKQVLKAALNLYNTRVLMGQAYQALLSVHGNGNGMTSFKRERALLKFNETWNPRVETALDSVMKACHNLMESRRLVTLN